MPEATFQKLLVQFVGIWCASACGRGPRVVGVHGAYARICTPVWACWRAGHAGGAATSGHAGALARLHAGEPSARACPFPYLSIGVVGLVYSVCTLGIAYSGPNCRSGHAC